ncbi:MAG TPA: molecular chaperone HtpG, partial [Proteiniphilum sp.]|nr:molecular chaperone HtpG [Proteiniphilum sp.]
VDFKALGESSKPVQITQNEFSRRMKEMAAMQQQIAFYGEMPDSYQLVLNADHPYIKELIEQSETGEKEELKATVTTEAKLKQMVDLALLAGGLLKGEALNSFVKRSFEMI